MLDQCEGLLASAAAMQRTKKAGIVGKYGEEEFSVTLCLGTADCIGVEPKDNFVNCCEKNLEPRIRFSISYHLYSRLEAYRVRPTTTTTRVTCISCYGAEIMCSDHTG
ncbi:hypothetical protein RchiOBHm_Chr6g0301231 [Rosa chinensis]|uniref:Uncharacterized protein n=1 Tax=Rosa chinensis TaxID=74649 RepID=A0A2P6PYQ0_ROSCH|nr:hypothetical protein RchiOBHm_Chr6g0301231 [Rosa chinensis]